MKKQLFRIGKAAVAAGRRHALDGVALAGAAAVLTGLWWIYPPASLIAGGGGALAFSLWATRCLQRLSWLAKREER